MVEQTLVIGAILSLVFFAFAFTFHKKLLATVLLVLATVLLLLGVDMEDLNLFFNPEVKTITLNRHDAARAFKMETIQSKTTPMDPRKLREIA